MCVSVTMNFMGMTRPCVESPTRIGCRRVCVSLFARLFVDVSRVLCPRYRTTRGPFLLHPR